MTTQCRTVDELRAQLQPHRRAGRRIGLVPTMGALHEGHLALVRAALAGCEVVVVSIFVNPLQFGPNEDFDAYPRTADTDRSMLEALDVDVVFAPSAEAFMPADRRTTVHVAGLAETLEGVSRPGHFDGVATVVTQLLNAADPDRAYFGEKDYQQLAVVRTLVRDLCLPVEVIGCPVVRGPDGVALSSRNAYLSTAQREAARALPTALHRLALLWRGDADYARDTLRRTLEAASGVRLDYAEVCDPETLAPLEGVVEGPAQALVAAHVGDTRLIDTIRLEPPASFDEDADED